MNAAQLGSFLQSEFPQSLELGFEIEHVGEAGEVRLRCPVRQQHLRPGGTVSGPTLMTLVDSGVYLSVLSVIGPVALAVTTQLNINFLRKPGLGDLIVESTLLKAGKRLMVGEVSIYSEGVEGPVAHATCTYSVPPPDHRG